MNLVGRGFSRHFLEESIGCQELAPVGDGLDSSIDLPGVIVGIDDSVVEVDFNHPLAGKDIIFRARILSVLPPDEQAVELKL